MPIVYRLIPGTPLPFSGDLLPVSLLLCFLAFLLGSMVASFINVVVYRLPRKLDFVRGHSFCPSCNHALGPLDLVPVFSYVFLGGKCRYCKQKISPRYPLVETLGGVLALLALLVFGPGWAALAAFALLAGLLAVAFIDIDTMEIPNGLVLYLLAPAAALVFLLPEVSILSHVIGFFSVSVPLLLIALLVRGGFGGGDIKLMAVCGLAVGWQLNVLAVFIAIVFGGFYGIILLATKKATRKQHFAFGPFLAFGVMVSLLFGKGIIGWYLGTFF